MAANPQHSSGEGLDDLLTPMASINVTPFVDVVLVLLVIFMVTAPMIMKETLNVRLPKTATGDGKKMSTLAFAVTASGNVLLNGTLTDEAGVRRSVREALDADSETQAIIAADVDTRHANLVRLIDWIKQAGLNRFALQIERQKL